MALAATESYGTEADSLTYHAAHGNASWADADLADREAALRNASQYITYNFNFIGTHPGDVSVQPLAWPRENVTISGGNFSAIELLDTVIPNEVEWACFELALIALTEDLDPALERGGGIKKEKIGDLETEYFESASSKTTYDHVRNLLKPYTIGGSGAGSVYRA